MKYDRNYENFQKFSYFTSTYPYEDESGTLSAVDFENAITRSSTAATVNDEWILNNSNDATLFEGDIELESENDIETDDGLLGAFVTEQNLKWPSKSEHFLLLPYTIPSNLLEDEKAQIAGAIWEFRKKTCVK